MKYTELNFSEEIDQWSCNENESGQEQCISKGEVCDNNTDCHNEKDEKDCPGVYKVYKLLYIFFDNQFRIGI